MDFNKWVIDPNILISYCISQKFDELNLLAEKHSIEICASEKLLAEFSEVISRARISKLLNEAPNFYVKAVTNFLSLYSIEYNFNGSPDKNDDYLIDIVQQTNAVGLVTGDKLLIQWKDAPIQIVTWNNFKLTYPV